jgi:integrase
MKDITRENTCLDSQKKNEKKGKRLNGEGSILELKDGSGWLVQLTLKNGQRKRAVRKTAAAARLELDRLKALRDGNATIAIGKNSVASFLEKWLKTVEAKAIADGKLGTYIAYEKEVSQRLLPILGTKRLDTLSSQDIELWILEIRQMRARGRQNTNCPDKLISVTTVLQSIRVLNIALNAAVRWKLIPVNPCASVQKPKKKKFKLQPYSPQEAQLLLDTVRDHKHYAAWCLALMNGLRRGEIAGLRWQDIDFKRGVLHIEHIRTRQLGNDRQLRSPKSEESTRTLPMFGHVAEALRERYQRQQQEKKQAGDKWTKFEDFVFTGSDGGAVPVENFNLDHYLATKKAGLRRIRLHDLRHSCATLLGAEKVPLKTIQAILGHSTFALTADLYSHVLPEMLNEAQAAMTGLFPTTPQPVDTLVDTVGKKMLAPKNAKVLQFQVVTPAIAKRG